MVKVNEVEIIDPIREMHYCIHHRIDSCRFPQVHDFYEISLITDGTMEVSVNQVTSLVGFGSLMLIRPGDVHNRCENSSKCSYINLAFPAKVISEMFQYLNMPDMQNTIMSLSQPPHLVLLSNEAVLLQMRLEKLNLCPINTPNVTCCELRRLVLDIMLQYFIPSFSKPLELSCPHWIDEFIRQLEDPEQFSKSLDELAHQLGYSKEHLCRDFRKHLGISPMAYINAKRLNYAANLLRHSDQKVIDIAYASGFQSLSRFYHAFKKEFHVTALEYRHEQNIGL